MQYRNIRVEDLTPGAPKAADGTGPFKVSGRRPAHDRGAHERRRRQRRPASRSTFDVGDDRAAGRRRCRAPCPLTPTQHGLPPMIDTPASFRLGTITSRITRATFARRGLTVPVACTGAMDGSAKLTVSSATRKRLKLEQRDARQRATSSAGARTPCDGDAQAVLGDRRALARKGGPRSVKLTLSVQMRDWGKPAQTRAQDDHAAALGGTPTGPRGRAGAGSGRRP